MIEACATGQIGRGDQVDYMGRGYAPIDDIEELARHLPMRTATTNQLSGPGKPDFFDDLAQARCSRCCCESLEERGDGRLFAERSADAAGRRRGPQGALLRRWPAPSRRLEQRSRAPGRVPRASRQARARGARSRAGRAPPLRRAHGRHADLARPRRRRRHLPRHPRARARPRGRSVPWRTGQAPSTVASCAPHVEFPLDLDLPGLMLAGLETAHPGDAPLETWRDRLDRDPRPGIRPSDRRHPSARAAWPALVVSRPCARDAAEAGARTSSTVAAPGGGSHRATTLLRAIEVSSLRSRARRSSGEPAVLLGRCRRPRRPRTGRMVFRSSSVNRSCRPEEVVARASTEDVVDAAEQPQLLMNS